MEHQLLGCMAITAQYLEYAATDVEHIPCNKPTERRRQAGDHSEIAMATRRNLGRRFRIKAVAQIKIPINLGVKCARAERNIDA